MTLAKTNVGITWCSFKKSDTLNDHDKTMFQIDDYESDDEEDMEDEDMMAMDDSGSESGDGAEFDTVSLKQ